MGCVRQGGFKSHPCQVWGITRVKDYKRCGARHQKLSNTKRYQFTCFAEVWLGLGTGTSLASRDFENFLGYILTQNPEPILCMYTRNFTAEQSATPVANQRSPVAFRPVPGIFSPQSSMTARRTINKIAVAVATVAFHAIISSHTHSPGPTGRAPASSSGRIRYERGSRSRVIFVVGKKPGGWRVYCGIVPLFLGVIFYEAHIVFLGFTSVKAARFCGLNQGRCTGEVPAFVCDERKNLVQTTKLFCVHYRDL